MSEFYYFDDPEDKEYYRQHHGHVYRLVYRGGTAIDLSCACPGCVGAYVSSYPFRVKRLDI